MAKMMSREEFDKKMDAVHEQNRMREELLYKQYVLKEAQHNLNEHQTSYSDALQEFREYQKSVSEAINNCYDNPERCNELKHSAEHLMSLRETIEERRLAVQEANHFVSDAQHDVDQTKTKLKELQKEALMSRFSNIGKHFDAIKEASQKTINNIYHAVHTVREDLDARNDMFKDMMRDLKVRATQTVENTKSMAAEQIDNMASATSKTLNAAKDTTEKAIDNTKETAARTVDAVNDYRQQVADAVYDGASQFANKVYEKSLEIELENTKRALARTEKEYNFADELLKRKSETKGFLKSAFDAIRGRHPETVDVDYTYNKVEEKAMSYLDNMISKYNQEITDIEEKLTQLRAERLMSSPDHDSVARDDDSEREENDKTMSLGEQIRIAENDHNEHTENTSHDEPEHGER